MAGYYETQVRRAMLTVGDANVLNEMATGWRASVRDLNTVDDRLKAGIDALRDHDQLGDRTRDAAVGAFRDMRGYVAEQRLMLGRTAQALDAAGGAVTQVKSLIRSWDRAGEPVAPGPAPVPDPSAADQTAYWNQANAHRRASDGYTQQVQQREEEARAAWDSLNRVFGLAEDKIRRAHGIPLEEDPTVEPTPWPPADWPPPPPPEPEPGWPPLPPWPPVTTTPDPGPGPGPGPGLPPGPGPGIPPGVVPGPETGPSTPPSGSPLHPSQAPSTTVSGSSQSGVAYAPGAGATSGAGVAAPTSAVGASMGVAGLAGAAGASAGMALRGAAAGAGAAGVAGRSAGGSAAGSSARSGAAGQGGKGSRAARSGSAAPRGAKGSQQAAGQARSGRSSAGSGTGGGRGGRRKDRPAAARNELLDTDDQWLDGEGTAPDVLR